MQRFFSYNVLNDKKFESKYPMVPFSPNPEIWLLKQNSNTSHQLNQSTDYTQIYNTEYNLNEINILTWKQQLNPHK